MRRFRPVRALGMMWGRARKKPTRRSRRRSRRMPGMRARRKPAMRPRPT